MSVFVNNDCHNNSTSKNNCELINSLDPNQFLYTSHYCEENIYKLIEQLLPNIPTDQWSIKAIFISNPKKQVPIWSQKCANPKYGLNTFPCSALEYCFSSFRPEIALEKSFQQYFRIVDGQDYLDYFASDRSHMSKQTEIQPPSYPCIQGSKLPPSMTMNLFDYISMQSNTTEDNQSHSNIGHVYSLQELITLLITNQSK